MNKMAARAIIGIILGVLSATMGLNASAAPAPPVSPPDRVVIVTANLLEGFSAADVRDLSEMDVFVDRVLDKIAHRPDVVLMQEVNSRSARYVAAEFTRRTGQTYAVIADAGDKAYRETDTRITKRDTAIAINTQTMSKAGSVGYIVTRYDRGGNARVEYKYNARALVGEDSGTMKLALASIHVPPAGITKTAKVLANRLDKAYPSSAREQFEVLGGDFNQVGIDYLSYGQVRTHAFWRALTGPFDYVDSIYNVVVGKGVDYVFVRGGVWGAGIDSSYDPTMSRSAPGFYSDHRFRWAIVGPDDESPSKPANVELAARRTDGARMKVSWGASDDNAGIAAYDVFRSTDGETFRKHGTTQNLNYYDETVTRGTTYWYYVVARDFSDNASPRSETVSRDA